MKTYLAASLGALALFSAPAAIARPMTEVDLATLERLSSPTVSPDGTVAVYQLTSTDLESNSRSSTLYMVDLTEGGAVPVPVADQEAASEHSPAFAPDGSLYYLTDAGGMTQLWRVTTLGGDPQIVSSLETAIDGFKLSPDGTRVALWSDIDRDCPNFGCPAPSKEADQREATGTLYDRQFVRHWDKWTEPGVYSRIFAFDIVDGRLAGGVPLDSGLVGNSPVKPFGGGEQVAWTADSKHVLFALREASAGEPRSTDIDIYSVRYDGGAGSDALNLTADNPATDNYPAASPDGKWIAWAAMARPGYESDRMVVKLMNLATREVVSLTEDWDRSVGSIAWTPDSAALIVTAQDVLDHPAYRVDIADGTVERLTGAGNVGDTIALADGRLVYTKNDLQQPTDIYLRRPDGSEQRVTYVNADRMSQIDEVEIERFSFAGAGGDTVWGQIVKPAGREGPLPVAFLVHGGPQGSFGNGWSTRWNPKVWASRGYAAVTIDFHGSAGYGQAFTDSINNDWGGKPLRDLKLGLAAAAAHDSQVDASNACALGGSYGGYMMNWIAGNWPDGFKCLVNHAGLFDLRSFYYATEELWFPEWDFGGPYWERKQAYERWNPVNHVDKWQTPMLVIHGEYDFRVPYQQSLMAFTALQQQDIPSKLLIYPDENHWILSAQNSVQWYRAVFDWMERWISP